MRYFTVTLNFVSYVFPRIVGTQLFCSWNLVFQTPFSILQSILILSPNKVFLLMFLFFMACKQVFLELLFPLLLFALCKCYYLCKYMWIGEFVALRKCFNTSPVYDSIVGRIPFLLDWDDVGYWNIPTDDIWVQS